MKIKLLALILMISHFSHSGRISRGLEALEIYNYFEAKRLFEKAMKKNMVAASYGLSIIYQRTDNPFSNLDSAYTYIVRAFNGFPALKLKKKEKYAELGIDSVNIVSQRNLISDLLFERSKIVHSVKGYQEFIDKNPWSRHIDSSIYFRDFIAWEKTVTGGRADDYLMFMNKYPNSVFSSDANSKYQKSLYLEFTSSNNFISYVEFIQKYPNSPYRPDAEDRIFEIYTKTGTVTSYRNFIREFPDNRNVPTAWRKLYNTHLEQGYSSESLHEFSAEFPEYPYKEELNEEMSLANTVFYPVKSGGNWGFVDSVGNLRIKPVYQGVEWFHEGLATVRINEKYGYINKRGQLEIAASFDDALEFNEGHAVVEVDEKWGMINRNGEFIIPAYYEDLGNLQEGLTYFQSDSGYYGYFDAKGIQRLKPVYDMAYDFENGKAIVSYNEYYGLIDEFGTTYIPFKYDNLIAYEKDIYAANLMDNWGLITVKGDTIIPFEYDYVGKIHNNWVIVEKEDAFNFVNLEGVVLLNEWIPVYPEYKQLAHFRNGYARIEFEDGFNLVDTNGIKLFKKDKEGVDDFGDLIAVKKGDNWGYMNPKNILVIDYQFTQAYSFKGNYAIAGNEPFWGLIDRKGNYLIDAKYEELKFINDTTLLAKSMGKYGLLSSKGDTLLNFHYISIEPIDDSVVKVEEGGEVYYFNLDSRVFIRKEE